MQRKIQIQNYMITYTLLIKNVKNINLHINQNGEIVVSCNAYVPIEKVDAFVISKMNWIIEKMKLIQKKKEIAKQTDVLLYLGKKYPVEEITSKYNGIKIEDNKCTCYIQESEDKIKIYTKFYREMANKLFPIMMQEVYAKMCVDYDLVMPTLKVRFMTSRWGSCMPRKNQITLNIQLIHYDRKFIEYVILHELAHLIQPNHSKAFYRVIEKYMPDYQNVSKNGPKIFLENE